MKTLLATTAFAVVVAIGSPASAQVYGQDLNQPGLRSFAQEQAPFTVRPRRNVVQSQDGRVHSSNPAYDVYYGRYIGSDPDPFIRNDLLRAPPDRVD